MDRNLNTSALCLFHCSIVSDLQSGKPESERAGGWGVGRRGGSEDGGGVRGFEYSLGHHSPGSEKTLLPEVLGHLCSRWKEQLFN